MRCESNDNLSRYVAGELPPRQRLRVETHLSQCASCRAEVAALRRLEGLLEAIPTVAPPAELPRQALARAQVALGHRGRSPLRPDRLVTSWGSVLAGAVAVCLLVWYTTVVPGRDPLLPAPTVYAGPGGSAVATAPAEPAPRPTVRPPAARVVQDAALAAVQASGAGRRAAKVAVLPRREMDGVRRPGAAAQSRGASAPAGSGVLSPDAAAALRHATMYAIEGDAAVHLAALENVAVAYPDAPEAAKALLTAAELHASQGDAQAADGAYRQVTALRSAPVMAQALAYKALGDLRRQSVGDDELAAHNYRMAANVLRGAAAHGPEADRATALVALGDVQQTLGDSDGAASAYARAAALGGDTGVGAETGARLAQVL